MTDSIRDRVDALVASLGELSAERLVHAATALRIASVMEGDEAPLYALPGLARELRNAVAVLVGDTSQIARGLRMDDALDEILRDMR